MSIWRPVYTTGTHAIAAPRDLMRTICICFAYNPCFKTQDESYNPSNKYFKNKGLVNEI